MHYFAAFAAGNAQHKPLHCSLSCRHFWPYFFFSLLCLMKWQDSQRQMRAQNLPFRILRRSTHSFSCNCVFLLLYFALKLCELLTVSFLDFWQTKDDSEKKKGKVKKGNTLRRNWIWHSNGESFFIFFIITFMIKRLIVGLEFSNWLFTLRFFVGLQLCRFFSFL